ncbi:FxLYD domain-containing protein [Streptomyces fulvoviolaceus]|uniref:FxLYD domain-containing protein n=1 Tax=Streptomyces fulvoviolaceus TaxID=285535 RepID=UPI0021BE9507|nr:FxLYD domain-containing protein [Streptomyces fulvoviolaceus]MCT9075074.1 FxLYD domain-containing protein [Streptomyces fulvoviolaceus]
MAGHRARWGTAAALTAVTAAALTGCSDDTTPSSVASKAASIASKASDVVASATAEAGRRFDDIKNGVNAKDDVRIGTPATASDGRTTVEVTATNTADSSKSFAVQVDFTDGDGKLVDAVVVTVSDVAAGGSGKGTARSTHDLSGEVKTKVSRAVRY